MTKTLLNSIVCKVIPNSQKVSSLGGVIIPIESNKKLFSETKRWDESLNSRISGLVKVCKLEDEKFAVLTLAEKNASFAFTPILKSKSSKNDIRDVYAQIARQVRSLNLESVVLPVFEDEKLKEHFSAALEGFFLGLYVFDTHKSKKQKLALKTIYIQSSEGGKALEAEVEEIKSIASSVCFTRNLVNEPANIMNPSAMEKVGRSLAKENGLKVTVLTQETLIKKGMNLLNSVGMGSKEKPRLLHLSYSPKGKAKKKIALVGKGVTFDTGGYSLKPQNGMYGMKADMGGAATCFGVASLLKTLKLSVQIDIYVPLVENMVSDRATKPGDVFKAYNGKTVEVENTDAEGRLILADALSYAAEQKPDVMIDMATLTGACVVALGDDITAVLSNKDSICNDLIDASERSGEGLWRLPLEKGYKKLLKSDVADMKNVGTRAGGTITAALFLQEFVGDTPWAHLDIAGAAFSDGGGTLFPKGGTGRPVRTLVEYLKNC